MPDVYVLDAEAAIELARLGHTKGSGNYEFSAPTLLRSQVLSILHTELVVEDDVFAWRIAGKRPTARLQAPPEADVEAWQLSVGDDETAEQVYALWDDAVARSRPKMADILTSGSLSDPGTLEFEEGRPSIRQHLCDLIEEYGRHTVHADLIREAIDGRVGEGPPPDWSPIP